jgi:hypothetical protein
MRSYIAITAVTVGLVIATAAVLLQSNKTACHVEFNESGGLDVRNCTFMADPETGRTRLLM